MEPVARWRSGRRRPYPYPRRGRQAENQRPGFPRLFLAYSTSTAVLQIFLPEDAFRYRLSHLNNTSAQISALYLRFAMQTASKSNRKFNH
jgi:hypothetical protein